jgi:3-oxoacyl-(acyl-carrier-protein) synthase
VTSAVHVAHAVDSGGRVGPLLFFQSVPNAVAGYIAARWGLTGPVVCVASAEAGMDVAAALIEDGDAEEALVVLAEQAGTAGERDSASAVLVGTRVEGLNSTARGDVDSTEGVFGRVGTT